MWNYDVCNDDEYGDHWNGENFSIYSPKLVKQSGEEEEDLSSLSSSTGDQTSSSFDTTIPGYDLARLHMGGRVLAAAIVS